MIETKNDYHGENLKKINQAGSKSLINLIRNMRDLDFSDSDIYDRLSKEYGLIVCILSKNNPEIRLCDIETITNVLTDFQKHYLDDTQ